MLFNSFEFLLFFPFTILLYFVLPKRMKNFWLLAASYIFYMGWNAKYALLLLFCTAVTFFASLLIEKRKKETGKIKSILIISIALILCVLFYYKYLNFAASLLSKVLSVFGIAVLQKEFDIILPVGISFFSFQAIGYLIDVYRGEIYAEKNFFKYALFVSFFPQLVAGPIERSKNLLKQLGQTYKFSFFNLKSGLFTMLYGYFLKVVVADRASVLVDSVYQNEGSTGIQIAFATFIFAIQIYCDFAGYSTIAKGAAKILGIELMNNFDAPYFSGSFQEFWRRWHISLSSWFRDYVYIPLGGSRKGTARKRINLMVVMFISGIWHGAGLNYIVWGLLHGFFQVVEDCTKTIRSKISSWIQICITFTLTCFTWIFFRAGSVAQAIDFIKKIIFELKPLSLVGNLYPKYGLRIDELELLFFTVLVIFVVDLFKYKKISIKSWILSKHWILQSAVMILVSVFIFIFGVYGSGYNASSFIYFQF